MASAVAGDIMPSKLTRGEKTALRLEIEDFNTRYAAALDNGQLLEWPKFFSDEPFYRVTSRENFDAGMPIGLIYCDSMGMIVDRATSILTTMVYAPRTIIHFITNTTVGAVDDAIIQAGANFLLVENLIDRNPSLLMAGRYDDIFVRDSEGELLLRKRQCIYDTVMIQTSLIFPV
jgi:anthranilate 1,2-dioxygenase small subunit